MSSQKKAEVQSDAYTGAVDPIVEMVGFRLSTATILFHTAVAERLGLNVTDLKCYSLIRQAGPLTAGELAEETTLTTGAITGVLDRLEKARLVRRARDPNDRRRVVIELVDNPEYEAKMMALYMPLGSAIMALVSRYNEEERALLQDFLGKATDILQQATADLHSRK